jgi:lipopolysaccharide transport system permease protein
MKSINLFKNIYQHKDLILQFTARELQLRHKGSRLGHLWGLLSPMMMLGLYLFIFGVVFGGRFGVLPNENFFDFALALFLGLSLFNLISEIINISPSIILSQPNFVKKIVFPLHIISITKTAASLYYCLLSVLICIVLAPFGHGGITINALYLPIIILPLAMTALGISWALSAIGVFVRDVNHITGFAATALMYASAIVYPPTKVPRNIWIILKINPIPILIDQARTVLLWHGKLNFTDLCYAYIASLIILTTGYWIFSTLRPGFAEVL